MLVRCQPAEERHVPAECYGLRARRDRADALAQRVRLDFASVGGQDKNERGQGRYHVSHGHHPTPASQARETTPWRQA